VSLFFVVTPGGKPLDGSARIMAPNTWDSEIQTLGLKWHKVTCSKFDS